MMERPARPPERISLFLDVDGTLLDLAATPESVVVPPDLLTDLEAIESRLGGALALVSGRSVANLDTLFAPKRFRASGVHGAEIRASDPAAPVEQRALPLGDEIWRDLAAVLDAFPGTFAENKRFSFAVHYRAAPSCEPDLHSALRDLLERHPERGLVLMPGHCVYEIKHPEVTKGGAIRALMAGAPFAGRTPIFIGDDVTDAPGFAAVKALGGKGFAVGRAFPDVQGVFPSPADVRRWLATIVRPEAS